MTDKILIDRALLKQALEMLNRINAADDDRDFLTEDEAVCTAMAIDELDAALRTALEQPQPPRQPLTNQVIQELADEGVFHANVFEIVRRIEEEHGIFKLRAHGIGGEK